MVLWAIPLAPLVAAVVTGLFGPGLLRGRSHLPCWTALAVSFGCSLILLLGILPSAERILQAGADGTATHLPESGTAGLSAESAIPGGEPGRPEVLGVGYEWFRAGTLAVRIDLRADSMSAIMLCMVTGVSLLVSVFGAGYMHHDQGYPRFFAAVSLFVFSMCMLVLSGSFLMLFVFWEAVGLCSYLLIGFWFHKPSAAAAARKAFVVNRIGDFGLIIGILLIWQLFGTLTFAEIFGDPARLRVLAEADPARVRLICLCLFLGAMGKSAQFPLQVWLPDAMEGPTPVSALIHAATMVTAGVYLVARCTPLFAQAPETQLVISGVGAATALISALTALTQTDLKRVLAYSTVSQLGFMFMAMGCGAAGGDILTLAVTAAMFHLFTHAFFKALLFLAAGSVMHSMGDVIDMRRFSGLRQVLPVTHATFLVGAAALAGVPLLAGFWSKDDILAVLGQAAAEGTRFGPFFRVIQIIAVGTALLTSFYTFRAYFMTFWGPPKFPEEAGHHPHDASPVMAWPLAVLAVCAAGIGILLGPTHLFAATLQRIQGLTVVESHGLHWGVMAISSLVALGGIAAAWFCYVAAPAIPGRLAAAFRPLYVLSSRKFCLDEIFQALIVIPLRGLAGLAVLFDRCVIDGLVDAAGSIPRTLSRVPRQLHSGSISAYAGCMWIGLAVTVVMVLSFF